MPCYPYQKGKPTGKLTLAPSDAIAIALRLDAPIWVMEEVVAEASIPVDRDADEAEKQAFSEFLANILILRTLFSGGVLSTSNDTFEAVATERVKYRRFGRTDLKLSVFSLGTMRCLTSLEGFCSTLEQGLRLGINHFETAQGYGASEVWLGEFLATQPNRAKVAITTKIPPKPDAGAMTGAIHDFSGEAAGSLH